MGIFGETAAMGYTRMRGYMERLIKDVPAGDFARKPIVNGRTIDTNHPAFVLGHLAIYPSRVMGLIGRDGSAVAVADSWVAMFKAGVPCQDDPAGVIYPKMDVISERFFKGYDAAREAVAAAGDEVFASPTPDERYREHFPTVGIGVMFLMNNHVAVHMGQISAWRRCMGMPAA